MILIAPDEAAVPTSFWVGIIFNFSLLARVSLIKSAHKFPLSTSALTKILRECILVLI